MKDKRSLLYAAIWCLLGVLALIFAPGNYFFYGFFVVGAIFVVAHFYEDVKRT